MTHRPLAGAAMLAVGLLACTSAFAAGKLTLYCSPQEEWCQLMVTQFQKETGIEVAMTRKSSGETFAQIRAERDNPKGDIWWGGTGDPHLQAAEEGLTEPYDSPMLAELHDWAVRQHERRRTGGPSASTRERWATATIPSFWPRKACRSRSAGRT